MLNKYLIGFLILTGLSSCRFDTDVDLVIEDVEPLNMVLMADEDGDYPPYFKICNQSNKPISLKGYSLLKNLSIKNLFTFPDIPVAVDSCIVVFLSGKNKDYEKLYWNDLLAEKRKGPWSFNYNFKSKNQLRKLIIAIRFQIRFLSRLDTRLSINDVEVPFKTQMISHDRGNYLIKLTLEGETLNKLIGDGQVKIDFKTSLSHNFPTYLFAGYKNIDCAINLPVWLKNSNYNIHTNFTVTPGKDALSLIDSSSKLIAQFIIPDIKLSKAIKAIDSLPMPNFIENIGLEQYTIHTIPKWLYDEKEGLLSKGDKASSKSPYFGSNFWSNRKVPAFLYKYGEEESKLIWLKVHGNYSRVLDQKSLSFKVYDGGSNITKIFRNAGQDNQKAFIRNAFVNILAGNNNFSHPVLLYAAGKNLGCYHLQTKLNEHYLQEKYGIPADEINLLESGISYAISGNTEGFLLLIKQIEEGKISPDELKIYFDLEKLIDYFIINIFIGNIDWPKNNSRFWNSPQNNIKWTYELFDCDISLAYGSENNDLKSVVQATDNHHSLILRTLLRDKEFKSNFIERYSEKLNGQLSYKQTSAKLKQLKAEMEPYMKEHFVAWPSKRFTYKTWEIEIENLDIYLKNRPYFAKKHLEQLIK